MKKKSSWIVLAATLLITVPARLYQMFFLMDKETGFYTDGGLTTGIVSFVLLVGTVVLIVLGRTDGEAPEAYRPIRSRFAAVSGVLAGLGLLLEGLVSMVSGGKENFVMFLILSLVGMVTGVVLIFTAYDFSTGSNRFTKYPLLALAPPIWGCTALVTLFISYVAVANVTENIFNTFTVAFLLLFLFSQAKMIAGVEEKKSGRMVSIFGLPAILFCLVTGIPGTAGALAGLREVGFFPVGLHFVDVLMAFYLTAFLTELRRRPGGETAEDDRKEAHSAGTNPSGAKPELLAGFLSDAYQSTETFAERAPSPFLSPKS